MVGGTNTQIDNLIGRRSPIIPVLISANADNLINIHESSSSIVLSGFFMVIISRIHGSFAILSVLFVGFFPFFNKSTK